MNNFQPVFNQSINVSTVSRKKLLLQKKTIEKSVYVDKVGNFRKGK